MAEVKWIKIATDIFDNRKIRQIETMPEGDAIIVIWLKILCLAGSINDGGQVYLTNEIPYTDQMLATQFNRPITVVQMALKIFEAYGMIEIIDDILKVSSWEKYQNIEGLEKIREQTRKRVAKHRERKRLQMSTQICQYCGETATGEDHIIALSRGGTDTEDNKVPCCITCNRIKNDKPLCDFLNSNRERINDDIVTQNEKLLKYVTLSNVTNRYEVTQGNGTDKNRKDKNREDINILFEKLWKAYPSKKGKGQVSEKKKKELYEIGEEHMMRAIQRYIKELEKDKWRQPQNGSTFFNSGYVDYLDENFEPAEERRDGNKFNDFEQRIYDYDDIERRLRNRAK